MSMIVEKRITDLTHTSNKNTKPEYPNDLRRNNVRNSYRP